MEHPFQAGILLLLIAAVVAMLTRRLRLPYSTGLVLAGILMGLLPFAPPLTLTRDLLFTALLPPLLFEASFSLDWQELRRNSPVIVLLATVGVVLSAAVTSYGMHWLAGWPWITASLFGVLIAATDPVSVIATFREARAGGRLLVLIEAESLLNDGTAAVAFAVVLAIATGNAATPATSAALLGASILGGIFSGAAVALASIMLAARTEDPLVENTFTTVAAYGSFLLADHYGFSGVLATMTAGLLMANLKGFGAISPAGKQTVQTFWEYAAFVANSLIFLLIGLKVAHQHLAALWLPALAAILLVTLGRAAAIYPCCALFRPTRLRVSGRHQFALFWGGLRGALALALALGLPEGIPLRDQIVTVSFAVVAFSVFVQGLTMTPLLERLGEIPKREK